MAFLTTYCRVPYVLWHSTYIKEHFPCQKSNFSWHTVWPGSGSGWICNGFGYLDPDPQWNLCVSEALLPSKKKSTGVPKKTICKAYPTHWNRRICVPKILCMKQKVQDLVPRKICISQPRPYKWIQIYKIQNMQYFVIKVPCKTCKKRTINLFLNYNIWAEIKSATHPLLLPHSLLSYVEYK
jgi:hypothetical protein